ncbi:MAG TPA: DUF72 domain-containing protein [Gaiellaceae bacterium]|nr:DUF72 domain-containing protein [Gaiellaceae bacterium]
MTEIRVGTCSWADQSLVKHWYPRGVRSSEDRLRYYAEHFDAVEIDSTFYRLPEEENAVKWAERTPNGFVFHVKAFGVMTRHPVRLEQLPPDLREGVPTDERGRVDRPPRELRAEVFRRFLAALEPLGAAGKLGGILLQFPPYVVFREASFDYLRWACGELAGHDVLVEFRHRSWLEDENRAETLALLEELAATHVIVDAPKTQARNLVPTVLARTSPLLYVRFHGRNARTWNIRGKSAAERFDYLYSESELAEWAGSLRELAKDARQAFALFNNNGRSPQGDGGWIAQAPVNALMLKRMLESDGTDG